MIDFKICYPDANHFSEIIKLKKLEHWQRTYIELDYGIGYWEAEHPFETEEMFDLFQNLIASFPIQKDNNHPSNFDPNPFDTIHVPEWISKDICFLLRDLYFQTLSNTNILDPQIHEWGNVYFKEKSKPITCWRIPHIDYVHGIVGNLWFTDHTVVTSSTKLYKYHGIMHNELYDFQLDETHPLHLEWRDKSTTPTRANSWFNISDSELARWGFELVGVIPTKGRTMTIYPSGVCHNPHITSDINFRWSHAFAFSHLQPRAMTMGDLIK
jgi:hypothetical protein